LDVLAIFAFALLLVTFLGVLQLWLWWQDRSLSGLATWGGANLVAATGLAALVYWTTRGDRLALDIGIGIIAASYGIAWLGARQFERQSTSIIVALLGALVWFFICLLTTFGTTLANRVVTTSAIFACYHLLIAHEFRRKRAGCNLPSRRALAVIFSLGVIIHGTRGALALIANLDFTMVSQARPFWFGVPTMFTSALMAVASVLLISVAKEEAQRRSSIASASERDAADRANSAKSRFLTQMSHELRTSLNGVLGMAQLLAKDTAITGPQHERILLLESSGRHLLAIVNDMLDIAAIEAGKLELAPRPTLVDDISRNCVDLMSASAEAKRIVVGLQLDSDLPIAVMVDPLRVRQIVFNLLSNAIKFTPPGGQVSLAVSRVGAGGLRISVTDTGSGIPVEVRPFLFQDFMRYETDAAPTEGSGLGLAISGTLARAMGGEIRHEPGPNSVGSTFIVELLAPSAEVPSDPVPLPRRAPQSAAGLRVLVVDDVSVNRKLMQAVLQRAGHEVELAANGLLAIAAVEQGELPDIILMDVQMPGLDGLATTRRIRALAGAAAQVPIIALTAEAPSDGLEAYLAAGMDGCITKPIEIEELLRSIDETVFRRAQGALVGRSWRTAGEELSRHQRVVS
jgi:signal transduction histidine kinase/CheY-like chemotaxis protein